MPPATDEPGRANSSTTSPSGATGSGETRSQAGTKRRSEGNDDERHDFVRFEDSANIAASEGPQDEEMLALKTKKKVSFWDGERKANELLRQRRVREDMTVVRARLGCKADVAEVYSPPRIVTVAEAAGLRGGFSLDFTVKAEDGTV